MSRIFFAELRRLFHFRLYYIECAAVVLFSVLYFNPPVIDSFLFYIMIVIGAFSAICVSQFIGMEYSCGTIRNKLATDIPEWRFIWLSLFCIFSLLSFCFIYLFGLL